MLRLKIYGQSLYFLLSEHGIFEYFKLQGCLSPIDIIIPEGSLLDPSDTAAVVGGNVQTSQRIVDVIFKAFKTVAASQGCMNNITFGQDDWGYYETVAGGAGAVGVTILFE